MGLPIKCTEALKELERTRQNLSRFWNLIYAVSVAFALLTIALVISLLWGNNPAIAVTGAGTIASGGGLLFVVNNKNQSKSEHEEAKKALREDCGSSSRTAAAAAVDESLPDEAIAILTGDR
jgi:hypothetical protein